MPFLVLSNKVHRKNARDRTTRDAFLLIFSPSSAYLIANRR
jgi:hypothetical protein